MNDIRDPDAAPTPPVEVPMAALTPGALEGVIDDFILREGTDYGTQDSDLAAKRERVLKQLAKGEAIITFDADTESVSILTQREWKARRSDG